MKCESSHPFCCCISPPYSNAVSVLCFCFTVQSFTFTRAGTDHLSHLYLTSNGLDPTIGSKPSDMYQDILINAWMELSTAVIWGVVFFPPLFLAAGPAVTFQRGDRGLMGSGRWALHHSLCSLCGDIYLWPSKHTREINTGCFSQEPAL